MKQSADSRTSGNVYQTLALFALPFLAANFIQALYGAVAMAVLGWFSTSSAIAAVSVGTQVMQMLNSLISGLTMGGIILNAQYAGGVAAAVPRSPWSTACWPRW